MTTLEQFFFLAVALGTPLLVTAVLALPAVIRGRSWRVFLRAWAVSLFGILVPGVVFLLAAFFQPEWKGACHFGWIDCFHRGKMVLLPLLLWATVCLYVTDVLRLERAAALGWVRWGLLNGAVLSTVCLAQGLATAGESDARQMWWGFLIPAYTAAWYTLRTWKTWRDLPTADVQAGYALLTSLPFWAGSVLASQWLYQRLPDTKPGCFVVTAASRGHPWLVGTQWIEGRDGRPQPMNAQLTIFRHFERVWQQRAPGSHAQFRRFYNVWGYRASCLIRHRILADAAYLLLKPAEFLARLLLSRSAGACSVAAGAPPAAPTPRLLRRLACLNNVLLLAAAAWFLLLPAVLSVRRCADPALRQPGQAPAFAWSLHRRLSAELLRWADARVASGIAGHLVRENVPETEWPIFTCVFYLNATEALQREWERSHPADAPDAPAVYGREAIRAAAALVADPVHHTWVREHWGTNYLHTENVFFRSLLISAFTHYEALTHDTRYHERLVDQARTLADDLDRSEFGVLEDYPGECYPIDVLAAIGWIRDSDRITGLDHAAFAARAVRGFEGRLADNGLPVFRINRHTLQIEDPTRGTGNSWSMLFAPALWPEQAQAWMNRYEQLFWQERFGARGFREYPKTITARDWGYDVDAGPIFGGFSPAANAFAIAGMRAAGRFDLAWPIAAQSITAGWPLPGGRFGTACLLSEPRHAPLLGEAALLSHFTTQPAPGVPIRKGHGLPPPAVLAGIFLYLLAFALAVWFLWRRARAWRSDALAADAPAPRVQIGVWCILMAGGAFLWASCFATAALPLVLVALLLPIDTLWPRRRRA